MINFTDFLQQIRLLEQFSIDNNLACATRFVGQERHKRLFITSNDRASLSSDLWEMFGLGFRRLDAFTLTEESSIGDPIFYNQIDVKGTVAGVLKNDDGMILF